MQSVYRYDVKYYSNEVLALFKMKRYQQAFKIIQKVLLFDPQNSKVLSTQAVLYAELSKLEDNQNIKLQLLKESLLILEYAIKYPSTNATVESIQQIIDKVKVLESRIGSLNARDFSEFLLNKGTIKDQGKFQKAGFKDLFKNTQQFNQYLKSAVSIQDLETPEYILDPLSYEILKRPLIIPSGISYDEHVLKDFFRTKGPVDPITKIPLNLNLLFPNHCLESYIKNSDKLASWRQTEAQILHANDDIEF